MTETTIALPVIRRRALIDSKSLDEQNLTVEVTWSTGSQSIEVEPFDSPFYERLSFDAEHVDMSRFRSGDAPVLADHGMDEFDRPRPKLKDILGVIEDAWIEVESDIPGETLARCRIKLSRRDELKGLMQDIKDRIVRNVSVGYNVTRYRDVTEPGDLLPVRLAIRWQPYELSILPVGEDDGAHLRSKREHSTTTTCILEDPTGTETMGKTTKKPASAGAETTNPVLVERQRGMDIRQAVQEAGLEMDFADELTLREENEEPISVDRARTLIQERLDEELPAENTSTPTNPGNSGITNLEAAKAERTRGLAIREMVSVAKLDSAFADELIQQNNRAGRPLSVERCRALIFDRLGEQTPEDEHMNGGGTTLQSGDDAWTKARAGMMNALEVRCGVENMDGTPVELTVHGQNFRGMRVDRMAEEFFTLGGHGQHVRGKNSDEIARFALIRSRALGATHGTTDFTSLMANVADKKLRRAYAASPSDWRKFSTKSSASDYKPMSRVNVGDYPSLAKVPEGAEYTMGTMGEANETYTVAKYGRRIAFTREAMINDDTNAFSRLSALAGRAASELEANIIWALVTANATMADGIALFAAGHGNQGTGLLGKDGLSAGRLAMRLQTGIDGKPIGVQAASLVVPAALETDAEELTTTLRPVTSSGVNPFSGSFKNIIVEPRLDADDTGIQWYMFADPAAIDIIEYAYLMGNEGPMIETREGFEIDGMEMKVRHEFGATALDFRGVYRSDGIAV